MDYTTSSRASRGAARAPQYLITARPDLRDDASLATRDRTYVNRRRDPEGSGRMGHTIMSTSNGSRPLTTPSHKQKKKKKKIKNPAPDGRRGEVGPRLVSMSAIASILSPIPQSVTVSIAPVISWRVSGPRGERQESRVREIVARQSDGGRVGQAPRPIVESLLALHGLTRT